MTGEVKDLDYYAAHPDEMPTDLATLEALMTGSQEAPEAEAEAPTEEAPAETQEAKEEAEAEAGEGQQDKEETEAPISSKDGKHTIPYDVLKTEREKRRAAELAMRELEERINALERNDGKAAQEAKDDSEISDKDLAEMAEDFPFVAKLLAKTRTLESQLQGVTKRLEAEESAKKEQAYSEVRVAVDNNPVLLHWEQNDPERWAAAIEADQKLQDSKAHQGLSIEQRFAKAVEVVNAFYGDDPTVPALAAPEKTTTQKPKGVTQVPKKSVTTRTLSDIPGGTPPAADPMEEFAALSPEELGARMTGMTNDQISALIARLG